MNITILGAGAWGTALAIALANRHSVVLWGRDDEAIRNMAERRENTAYLPGFPLPGAVAVSSDFDAAIAHVARTGAQPDALLIAACPVAGLRPLTERLKPYPIPNIVWLCKGIEENTNMLPHRIVRDVLGSAVPVGALSGPSFAQEVARCLPCALTAASDTASLRELIVNVVHGRTIRVYSTDDLIGVEVGGAVKNVLAIATGVIDGLGLGLNARAGLITRGLAEMIRLGTALGGRAETFMGLTGVGDLILTCTGDLSRNRTVGLKLAQGIKLDDIVQDLGHVAEGVRCARAVYALATEHGIEMPITEAVAAVLFDTESPRDLVARMLSRDPRDETP